MFGPFAQPCPDLRALPSEDLRRWEGLKERYSTELDAKQEAASALAETSLGGRLTLLFAARAPVHNNAAALREYLLRVSKIAREEIGEEPE